MSLPTKPSLPRSFLPLYHSVSYISRDTRVDARRANMGRDYQSVGFARFGHMDATTDAGAWAEHMLRVLQTGIHARLVGCSVVPPLPRPKNTLEAMSHLSVLLSECEDLLAFEQVEKSLQQENFVVKEDGNDAFNYALAVQAVHALQQELHAVREDDADPDATIVASPDTHPWHKRVKDTIQELEDRHADEMAQIYAQHSDELEALRSEHAADEAQQARDHHDQMETVRKTAHDELESVRAGLHAEYTASIEEMQRSWSTACASLSRTIDDLHSQVASHAQSMAPVSKRIYALHEVIDALAAERMAVQVEVRTWRAKHAAVTNDMASLHEQLASRQSELAIRSSRLNETERQLHEVQREMECTAQAQADMDEMQARVAAAEAEVTGLREQLRALEPLCAERTQLASEVHELQKLVSMYKDSVSHAQLEHERTQQQLEKAEAQRFALEQELAERETELKSQRKSRAPRASSHDQATRIAELECELNAKAAEIEDGDTRLLTVMKENKRLLSQLKALKSDSKRALQDVTNAKTLTAIPSSPTKQRMGIMRSHVA